MCDQVVYDNGVYVCAENGEVLGPELVAPNDATGPGLNVIYHDYGIGSEIDSRHRSVAKVLAEIIEMGTALGLSWSTIKEATFIARRARARGTISRRELVLGSLCVAANNVFGLEPQFFSRLVGMNVYRVTKTCRKVSRLSGILLKKPDPRNIIATGVSNMNIPAESKGLVAKKALELYYTVRPFVHSTTRVLVAACVYVACKELGVPAMYGDLMRAFHVSDSPVCNAKNKVVRLLNALGKVATGKKTTRIS